MCATGVVACHVHANKSEDVLLPRSDERNASDGPNKGDTHYNNKGFSGRSVLQGFGNNNSNFQKSTSKSLTKVFVCLKTELDGVLLIVFLFLSD